MSEEKKWVKLLSGTVALLIVVGAVVFARWLIKTRPAPPRQPLPRVEVLVETIAAESGEHRIEVEAKGTVRALQEVDVMPEVGGLVIWKNPNLIAGGIIAGGEPLVRIDTRNYRAVVEERRAALEQAQVEYELESSRRAIAEEEWRMLGAEEQTDDRFRALALREPQARAAAARVEAARVALERAELDVERTEIKSPFNAVVIDEFIDVGQAVGTQTRLAKLAGTDFFLVEAAVPARNLRHIDWPDDSGEGGSAVVVEYDLGGDLRLYGGRVVRVLSSLGESARLARVLIEISDPLQLESGRHDQRLFAGAYVRCLIAGSTLPSAFALPSELLRQGQHLWIMSDESELEIRPLTPIWRQGGQVLIDEGLADGERIVSSYIAVPMPGMALRERSVVRDEKERDAGGGE